MAGKIKGITLEIGGDTKGLSKALSDVNKQVNGTQKELKEVERLLKLDPKNTELLAQKQQLLSNNVDITRKKLEALKRAKEQADRDMQAGTEVNQQEYRRLQREIVNAEQSLESLQKRAAESKTGIQNIKNFGNAAGEIGDKLSKAGSAMMPVTGALTGIAAGAAAAAESTREYREDLGKLDTAFQTAGFTVEAARAAYESFYVLLGEEDRSVEAVNHLAELCSTEEELAQWSDICAGVTAKFGDSLPIEGLTEAANETAKVGTVTGTLADALNWAGKSEDEFNAELEKCADEQERSQLITSTLTGLYKDAAAQYRDTNAEIIKSRQATSEMNAEMANLGATVDPIVTDLKSKMADMLGAIVSGYNGMSESGQQTVLTLGLVTAAAGPALSIIGKFASGIDGVSKAFTSLIGNPVGLALGALAVTIGFVATTAEKTGESLRKLSAEEQALCDSIKQRESEYENLENTQSENLSATQAEIRRTQELWGELQKLADESGRVDDANRTRAQYILGELNNALGTEYAMNGNIIGQYKDMQTEIDNLVKKKQAQSLIEYIEPLAAEARMNMENAKADVEAVAAAIEEQEKVIDGIEKSLETARKIGQGGGYAVRMYEDQLEASTEKLQELQNTYNTSKETVEEYNETISKYDQASFEMFSGNADKVIAILSTDLPNAADQAIGKTEEVKESINGIDTKKEVEIAVKYTGSPYYVSPLPKNPLLDVLDGFASGTKNAHEGLSVVNEEGPELIEGKDGSFRMIPRSPALTYLNRGDKVYTAEETKKMAGGVKIPGFASGKTPFETAKDDFSHRMRTSEVSLAQELAWWKDALATYADDAEAVKEANEEIYALTKELNKQQSDDYQTHIDEMMREDERWNEQKRKRGEIDEQDYLWNLGNRADQYRKYADEVMTLDYMTEEERLRLRKEYIEKAEDLDDQYLDTYQQLAQNVLASIQNTLSQVTGLINEKVSGLDLDLQIWKATEGKDASELEIADKEVQTMTQKLAEQAKVVEQSLEAYNQTKSADGATEQEILAAENAYKQAQLDYLTQQGELEAKKQERADLQPSMMQALMKNNQLINENGTFLRAMGYTDQMVSDWAAQVSGYDKLRKYNPADPSYAGGRDINITNYFTTKNQSPAEIAQEERNVFVREGLTF